MIDFDIQRCTRRCAATNREFNAGESFYSVLVAEGSQVLRYDYADDQWEGPPENSLGWWRSRMPDANAKTVNWAPNDVMVHYFEQLAAQPDKQDVRYVLALLMIRRRVVRLEESKEDEKGQETMVLYCPRNDNEYSVNVLSPTRERIDEIQEILAQLLFADSS